MMMEVNSILYTYNPLYVPSVANRAARVTVLVCVSVCLSAATLTLQASGWPISDTKGFRATN